MTDQACRPNFSTPFPPLINLDKVLLRHWNRRKMPPLRPSIDAMFLTAAYASHQAPLEFLHQCQFNVESVVRRTEAIDKRLRGIKKELEKNVRHYLVNIFSYLNNFNLIMTVQ